jgi:putative ABC transport system permease protein
MGMILKIALRNIGRHKRRTVLSAITIAAGLVVFVCIDSMLNGIDRMSIDNLINLSAGALKIQTSSYEKEKESFPLAYSLDSSLSPLLASLSKDNRVTHVTRRTQFIGQLSNYDQIIPVMGTVVDPRSDTLVFGLRPFLVGSYFDADNTREIVIGRQLATDLGVGVGDNITLYALTKYDSRNADVFRIAGVLSTADPGINHSGVFMTYAAANDFLDLENSATEIDVAIVKSDNLKHLSNTVSAVQNRLRQEFPSLHISSFLDLGASVMELTKAKRVSGFVFTGIILIIAVVGIFNTVFMSVYERIREIGVLRAHGMKPRDISSMFVLEGVITGMLGSALGILVGALLNIAMVTRGIPMEKMGGSIATASYGIAGTVYGQWNVSGMIVVFLLGVAVATVAGIIPARRASKIPVTEALRFS